MPNPPQDPSGDRDNTITIALLNHARDMVHDASNVRMRNFNFFLILVGILFASYTQLEQIWAPRLIGLSGLVLGFSFWGLDIRGRQYLLRAQDLLAQTESVLLARIGMVSKETLPLTPRWFGLASHTRLYPFLFTLVAIVSLVLLLLGPIAKSGN